MNDVDVRNSSTHALFDRNDTNLSNHITIFNSLNTENKVLKEKVSFLETVINENNSLLDEIQKEFKELSLHLAHQEESNSAITFEQLKTNEENKMLKEKVIHLETIIEDNNSLISDIKKDFNLLSNHVGDQETKANSTLIKLREQVQSDKTIIQQMMSKENLLQNEIENLRSQKSSHSSQYDELLAQYNKSKEEVNQLDHKCKRVEDHCKNIELKCKISEKELEESRNLINKLVEQEKTLVHTHSVNENSLKNEIDHLKTQIHRSTSKHDELLETYNKSQDEMNKLDEKCKSFEDNCKYFEEKCKEFENELEQSRNRMSKHKEEDDDLKTSLTQQHLKNVEEIKKEYEILVSNERHKYEELIRKLEQQNKETTQEFSEFKSNYENIHSNSSRLLKDKTELEKKLEKSVVKYSELDLQMSSLETKYQSLERYCDELKNRIDGIVKENEQLAQKNNALAQKNDSLTQSYTSSTQKNEEIEKLHQNLMLHNNELKGQIISLKGDLQVLESNPDITEEMKEMLDSLEGGVKFFTKRLKEEEERNAKVEKSLLERIELLQNQNSQLKISFEEIEHQRLNENWYEKLCDQQKKIIEDLTSQNNKMAKVLAKFGPESKETEEQTSNDQLALNEEPKIMSDVNVSTPSTPETKNANPGLWGYIWGTR